jgi:hypothetical protein
MLLTETGMMKLPLFVALTTYPELARYILPTKTPRTTSNSTPTTPNSNTISDIYPQPSYFNTGVANPPPTAVVAGGTPTVIVASPELSCPSTATIM